MSNYQSSAGKTSYTQTEGWRHSTIKKTNLAVGDLVLIRDHASKTFMPKYKVDFRIVRILGNKVEVKDNHGKLSFYHISDIKKTDMITKTDMSTTRS